MPCPRCGAEAYLIKGRNCTRCGYEITGNSGNLSFAVTTISRPVARENRAYRLTHGAHLDEGRYRLMNQMILPETQHRQGTAWVAIDTHASNRRVLIREMLVPREMARNANVDQLCYTAVQHLQGLGQHAGLPTVRYFFVEHGAYFAVFDYPEGVTLASVLARHGGALPEKQVVAYGYQICGLLSILADQQPPLVHGSINPETLLIDEDQGAVALIHLPLFKPDAPPSSSGQVSAGYYAPEQMHGEITPSSDLYGLAVTMHHMVTGYDPRTRLALFHPPVHRLNPAVTKQMELILTRQLSLSASQRYTHPREMQRDLENLLAAYPDTTEHASFGNEVHPLQLSSGELYERSKNTLLLNMGVFAAICVLLLIGIFLVILR